jgi:DNA-binding response OmpR family regulator
MTKTIVWIEDDTDIIDPVVRPLEKAGYQIIRMPTASEALANVDQIKAADLILLDMILRPGNSAREFSRYSGLDVLRELYLSHGVKTPVIALTVVTRDEIRQQLNDLGAVDIIRKPVRPSELKERVEGVLQTAKSQQVF